MSATVIASLVAALLVVAVAVPTLIVAGLFYLAARWAEASAVRGFGGRR